MCVAFNPRYHDHGCRGLLPYARVVDIAEDFQKENVDWDDGDELSMMAASSPLVYAPFVWTLERQHSWKASATPPDPKPKHKPVPKHEHKPNHEPKRELSCVYPH